MSDPDQIIADHAQRRREGPLNLDRLAVSGAIEEMPEKPWRWAGPSKEAIEIAESFARKHEAVALAQEIDAAVAQERERCLEYLLLVRTDMTTGRMTLDDVVAAIRSGSQP